MPKPLVARIFVATVCAAVCCPAAVASSVNFEVALASSLDSQTAKVGQTVHARLLKDLHVGSKLVAPAGSDVLGRVTKVFASRRLLRAEVSKQRWMRAGGGIEMHFDRIVPPQGKPIKINAKPAGQVASGHQKQADEPVTVSKAGTVEAARKKDLKPKLARTALGIGALVAGPVTAAAGAAVGAVRPKTVLPESQATDNNHPSRLKGMATGFVAGLPGGFLVNDAVLKGQKAVIPAGQHLELEWQR